MCVYIYIHTHTHKFIYIPISLINRIYKVSYFLYALYFKFLFVFCFHFRPRPYLFKGDHKFPTNRENLPVIILYAEMGTRAFRQFHTVLSEKAQNGEILYVLRHYIQVHVCFTQDNFGYKKYI